MAMLPTTCYRHNSGLTLIEVLIALAIISIAMTAIIKATTQNIMGTSYVQDKTIAMWVGEQAINEVRAGVVTLSKTEPLKDKTIMLDREWYWIAKYVATPNPRIREIEVRVYTHDPEQEDQESIIDMQSYVYDDK